jgi:hypothetical protein
MEQSENDIELDFNNGRIFVKQYNIGSQPVFRIRFSDERNPLVITRGLNAKAVRFWTSVPEGRQPEAEETGKLISCHFKLVE